MHKIQLILPLLLLVACGKDDPSPQYPELEIDLVTGLELVDENGQAIATLGNPNIRNKDITVYPIPASDVFQVQAQQPVDTMWMVEATGQKTQVSPGVDYAMLLEGHSYSTDEITEQPVLVFVPGASNFVIDPGNLAAGYYRLFFKRPDGTIDWTNLYFDPDKTLAEIRNELIGFWE